MSSSTLEKVEPPALPCRVEIVVENGAAMLKSYLSPLEMRSPTAAGGSLLTSEISTAISTTFDNSILWFCLPKRKFEDFNSIRLVRQQFLDK